MVTAPRIAVARRRAASRRRVRNSTDSRLIADAGAVDIGAAGSIGQPPVGRRRGNVRDRVRRVVPSQVIPSLAGRPGSLAPDAAPSGAPSSTGNRTVPTLTAQVTYT